LLSSSFLLVQSSLGQDNSKDSKGQVTVRGCVSRSSGDYILSQVDPPKTYELQGTSKVKIGQYLGQEVEATGTKSASLSTSSDAMAKMGSPAPTTLTVTSIKTVAKECTVR
jgi:hypothetical protein